ncbi:hydantoinase/oxoprolinase N-terminal domain-containing protein [Shimia biformata]|uniref:hydantoinase/oxoprolinase N-terminal domain-containing protein n=1 Tax=Shimia biformata TaxID=1294299 RepID=UPI0019518EB6|nr:hydantoinase/oxoprolinase family protein [Shimia biformata]
MTLALGVDTGGTYTDAVLVRDEREVVARAKSLTTHDDLSTGIGRAVAAVLETSGVDPSEIGLASLSTTLATNALVEGRGEPVALLLIGFSEGDLARAGLGQALGEDPLRVMVGGHDHAGAEVTALDVAAIADWAREVAGRVTGFAVAAQFATRNPGHEQAARAAIADATGLPVTCSHELSARLNGPKRALTALLNARLIGMIARLIERGEAVLRGSGIDAPLMVVRGDGALISAEQARHRPVETILSGPAASLVGARWLTGVDNALVSDIGGTTTDIAILRDGRPAIDPMGAMVGTHRTMVEAVAMVTHGLGGDSEVHVRDAGLQGGVTLGPRRVLPVSLLAEEFGSHVHDELDARLRSPIADAMDGRFVVAQKGANPAGLEPKLVEFFNRLGEGPTPLRQVVQKRREASLLERLVGRGLVRLAAVTPTDASHVLGHTDAFDASAAEKVLTLMARRRIGSGEVLARTAADLARMILTQLTEQSAAALLETALNADDGGFGLTPAELARLGLLRAALAGHRGILRLSAGLEWPVIALGASAATYYPAVGKVLNAEVIVPTDAGVANAIGAVVGRVTVRRQGTVTSPREGLFRAHLATGPQDFPTHEAAIAALETALVAEVEVEAQGAGAEALRVTTTQDITESEVEGRRVFVEARVTAQASGRPRVA